MMTDQPTTETDPGPSDKGAVRGRLPRIVGRLVQAGQLKDTHGDTVHGVLIDCGKAVIQDAKLPLYQDVQVLHFRSTPDEILEYLDAGIPVKTLREVYERLRVELEPTRIHSPNARAVGPEGD